METSHRAALVATIAALAACSLTTPLAGYAGPPSDDGDAGAVDARAPLDARERRDGEAESGPPDAATPQYEATVLADSPLLYYRLGETMTTGPAADRASSARDASFRGKVTAGVQGAIANDPDTAVRFDGTTAAVVLDSGPVFAGKVAYSIEAWVRPTSFAGTAGHIVAACQASPNGGWAMYFYLDPKVHFERETNTGTDDITSPPLAAAAYAHLVGTFDGTTERLYVGGLLVASAPSSRMNPSTSGVPFAIGANGITADINRFEGDIDEVAVYDHALSPERVLAHFKVGTGTGP